MRRVRRTNSERRRSDVTAMSFHRRGTYGEESISDRLLARRTSRRLSVKDDDNATEGRSPLDLCHFERQDSEAVSRGVLKVSVFLGVLLLIVLVLSFYRLAAK